MKVERLSSLDKGSTGRVICMGMMFPPFCDDIDRVIKPVIVSGTVVRPRCKQLRVVARDTVIQSPIKNWTYKTLSIFLQPQCPFVF